MSENLQLAKTSSAGQSLSMQEIEKYATLFHQSGMFSDVRAMAQAAVKIIAGQEFGFSPFESMTDLHVIQGKITLGANAMAKAIKRSGKYNYKVIAHDEKICSIDFFQNGEKAGNSSFTIEDARKAGVKNLDKFPRNMLFARCISNGLRWFAPDAVNATIYTPEEIEAIEPEPPPTPNPPHPPRELQRGETSTQLPPPPVIEAEVISDPIADASKEMNTYPTADDLPNSDPRTTEATRLRNQLPSVGINRATSKDMAAPFLFSLLGCETTIATVEKLRTANASLEKALKWPVFVGWCNGNWAGSLARKAEILGLIVAVLWVESEGAVVHIVGTNPEQLNSVQQVKLIERLSTFLQPEFAPDAVETAQAA